MNGSDGIKKAAIEKAKKVASAASSTSNGSGKIVTVRNADKFLEIENGCLSLVITQQILTENLALK